MTIKTGREAATTQTALPPCLAYSVVSTAIFDGRVKKNNHSYHFMKDFK